MARLAASWRWQHIVDDLSELSEVEVEQDGRRALLLRTATGPTIDPICRAIGKLVRDNQKPVRTNTTRGCKSGKS
jgi:hypothetical protein